LSRYEEWRTKVRRYEVNDNVKGARLKAAATESKTELAIVAVSYFTFRTSRVRSSKGWAPPEKASTSSRILSAMASELSW
jgi:hypothetical protein